MSHVLKIGFAALIMVAACHPKPKPIQQEEAGPITLSLKDMSDALALQDLKEDLVVRLGGREDFEASVAIASRYAEEGVNPAEVESLRVEVDFLANRYFGVLEQEIEGNPSWPDKGKPQVWKQRSRLALASARRDFAFQLAVRGDPGGAIHGTDRIRAWMKGEARPITVPPADAAEAQITAMAGVTGGDPPTRPITGSAPPTALTIPGGTQP